MPSADDLKASELETFFNDSFPGANAKYEGPDNPSKPHERRFRLPGVSKRVVIDEHAFAGFGGSKPLLEKIFTHFDLLRQLDAGPGDYTLKKEGSKIKVER